jgi:hypothetical protein
MGLSRKEALKRIEGIAAQVDLHLEKIGANPNSQALSHWKREIRNWLQTMEALLPHVGKKTSAQWQTRLDACRTRLETSNS